MLYTIFLASSFLPPPSRHQSTALFYGGLGGFPHSHVPFLCLFSFAQQGVRDGELLVLDIIDAEVEFTPIFESPSSAVAVLNQQQYSVVTAETARRVAGVVVGAAVAAVTALVIVTLAGVTAFNRGFPVHVTSLAISFVLFAVLHGGVAWAIVSIVRGGDEGPLAAR